MRPAVIAMNCGRECWHIFIIRILQEVQPKYFVETFLLYLQLLLGERL